jgi:hypothetical protein
VTSSPDGALIVSSSARTLWRTPNGSRRRSRPLDNVEAFGPQIGDHNWGYTAAS